MRKNAALWPAVASERGIVNLRRNLLFEERVFSLALAESADPHARRCSFVIDSSISSPSARVVFRASATFRSTVR